MEKKTKGKENKKRRLCKMTKRKSRNVGVSHHGGEGKNRTKTPSKGKESQSFQGKAKTGRKGGLENAGKLADVTVFSPEIVAHNLCKRCISFLGKWCYYGHKLQRTPRKRFSGTRFKTVWYWVANRGEPGPATVGPGPIPNLTIL